FILAMLGAQSIGAAVVPLNTRYTGHEAAAILARSRCSVLVLADGFLGRSFSTMLRDAAAHLGDEGTAVPGLPSLRLVVGMDDDAPAGPAHLGWTDFLASGTDVPDDVLQGALDAVAPDDVVDILFTSGTT